MRFLIMWLLLFLVPKNAIRKLNDTFEKFCKGLKNNDNFVKRKPNIYEIHVVTMCDKFESWGQLKK